MKTVITVGVLVIVALIFLWPGKGQLRALYVVDETEQAIVLQFGEVKAVKTSSGLYFKLPFVQQVVTFDRRILRIDAPPVAMPDEEKQNLIIDSYARYRITDPVQFRKTLQTEINARSRLGDIVTAAMRAEIATSDRNEIVGGTLFDAAGRRLTDELGNPIVETSETRTELLERVLQSVRRTIAEAEQSFGIEMIDVRLKRADFPGSVTPSIYTRMRAERNRIAAEERALGDKRNLEIRAAADKDREIILADAERESNQLRGEGEAEAIRILAEALEEDPEFFAFRRSLQAYRMFLNQGTTVILSADADLFQFLDTAGVSPTTSEAGE